MITVTEITHRNTHLLANPALDVFDYAIDAAHLTRFLAQSNHFIAVGQSDGVVVAQVRAIAQYHPDAPPVLYIENLGVTPAFQRQGLASRLIDAALAWGRGQGCAEAWVATELDNLPALGLYRRFASAPMQPVAYCQLNIDPIGEK